MTGKATWLRSSARELACQSPPLSSSSPAAEGWGRLSAVGSPGYQGRKGFLKRTQRDLRANPGSPFPTKSGQAVLTPGGSSHCRLLRPPATSLSKQGKETGPLPLPLPCIPEGLEAARQGLFTNYHLNRLLPGTQGRRASLTHLTGKEPSTVGLGTTEQTARMRV